MFVFNIMYMLYLTTPTDCAQSGTDAKNLLTALFTTNAYNKKVRPLEDQTQPVTIYMYAEFVLNSKYHHTTIIVLEDKCTLSR